MEKIFNNQSKMKRRKFFKTAGVIMAGVAFVPPVLMEASPTIISADIATGRDTLVLALFKDGRWAPIGGIQSIQLCNLKEIKS